MHAGTHESFGHKYQVGDIVGCFIDVADRTISKSPISHFKLARSKGPIIHIHISSFFFLSFFEFSGHYYCICLALYVSFMLTWFFILHPCPKTNEIAGGISFGEVWLNFYQRRGDPAGFPRGVSCKTRAKPYTTSKYVSVSDESDELYIKCPSLRPGPRGQQSITMCIFVARMPDYRSVPISMSESVELVNVLF